MTRRSVILWGALLATLAASWWATTLDDDAVPAGPDPPAVRVDEPAAAALRPSPAGLADELPTRREPWPAWAAGIMQPMPFALPPPPPVASPVAPGAPPLPFRYVGALEEAGGRAVILLDGDEVHIVRPHQRIGDRYRVERISATDIEFTYLPLMQRQRLGTSSYEQYQ